MSLGCLISGSAVSYRSAVCLPCLWCRRLPWRQSAWRSWAGAWAHTAACLPAHWQQAPEPACLQQLPSAPAAPCLQRLAGAPSCLRSAISTRFPHASLRCACLWAVRTQ